MTKLDYRQICMRCTEEGECMLWQQGVNSTGYPIARIDGKPTLVAHHVFYNLMGRMKRKGYVVTPRCGNQLCVSQECLIALTYSERIKRTYASGARSTEREYFSRVKRMVNSGKTKLDFDIADDIRANRMDVPNSALAAEMDCHPKTIYQVKRGKTWLRVAPGASVFTLAGAA